MSIVVAILVALAALYAAAIGLVVFFSLRPPRIPVFLSPGAFGLRQEDVVLKAFDGVRLAAWWAAPTDRPIAGVAVMAHGYVMSRSELVPLAVRLAEAGIASLLFDFRGHGRSQGAIVTLGPRERLDVQAAVAFCRERQPGTPVAVIGSSMGAAAACLALADDPNLAEALVLDSCYSKLVRAASGWWRLFGGPVAQVLLAPATPIAALFSGTNPYRVDIAECLRSSPRTPTLIFHGTADTLAVPAEAKRNLAALQEAGSARPIARLVWLEGCQHSEGRWIRPREYESALAQFLRDCGIGNWPTSGDGR
ncbi:MAG: alpha/beta fold hydrolase [Fimbriimonadaceae bacterium]